MVSPLKTLKRVPVKLLRIDTSSRLEQFGLNCLLILRPGYTRALWRRAILLDAYGTPVQALEAWQRVYLATELSDKERSTAALARIAALRGAPGAPPLQAAIAEIFASPGNIRSSSETLNTLLAAAAGLAAPDIFNADGDNALIGDGNAVPRYGQTMMKVLEGETPDNSAVDGFWRAYDVVSGQVQKRTITKLQAMTLEAGKIALRRKCPDAALLVAAPAFARWSRHPEILMLMARALEQLGDWEKAVVYWQFLGALAEQTADKHPVLKGRTTRKSKELLDIAKRELRLARISLARLYRQQADRDGFSETVARIVESLPDQQLLKGNPDILDIATHYVADRLRPVPDWQEAEKVPQGLRVLVVCLDVVKCSAVHNHARIVFSICGRLLEAYPELTIHLVATQERLAVNRPILNPSYYPPNGAALEKMARQHLGDAYGKRFHIDIRLGSGLAGVVDTCNAILALNPDVVLYGGGHKGLYSNESRLVRHALFPHAATGFFYIQSDNEIDDRIDVIIARGPHIILGDKRAAEVMVQPYPTFVANANATGTPPVRPARKDKKRTIVSALVGYRRFRNALQKIPRADLERILHILDDNPQAVWHLVGARSAVLLMIEVPALVRYVLAGRIRAQPVLPADRYAEFVGRADLFLHLPGFTGGSGGAAVARRQGVPILTFTHSDVSGRQPPETVFAQKDVEVYCQVAHRILTDAGFAQRIAESQAKYSQNLHRTATEGFYACLVRAKQVYEARRQKTRASSGGTL